MTSALLAIVAALSTVAAASQPSAPPPQQQPTGMKFVPADVDWDHPVYESSFDDPRALEDWKLEGGLRMSVADGNLVLQSTPGSTQSETNANHLVCWLTKEMPADFLLKFSVRPENRKQGLNISSSTPAASGAKASSIRRSRLATACSSNITAAT